MNWLGPVLRHLNSSERPEAHRNLLMIRAVDLSDICDRFVPLAPEPIVTTREDFLPLAPEPTVTTPAGFRIGWEWPTRGRQLMVLVNSEKSWVLLLVDGEHRELVERPAFKVLETSVRSFFEGWEPPQS